jgi:transcription elongation factor GreA
MHARKWVNRPIDFGLWRGHPLTMASPQATIPAYQSWPGDSRGSSPAPRSRAVMTREGERALRGTLERLRHQLEVDFAARMREDRTFGEIAGNDEYLQTYEEAAVLTSRIAALEALLDSATVVAKPDASLGIAALGNTIAVEDVASGIVRRHRLIGDYEELRPDAVSASSPVGRALMGRSPGDEVDVELPSGERRALRIRSVEAPGSD